MPNASASLLRHLFVALSAVGLVCLASCDSDKPVSREGSAATTTKGAAASTGSASGDDDDDDASDDKGTGDEASSASDDGTGTEDQGTGTDTASGTGDGTGSLNIDILDGGADPEANFKPVEFNDADAVAYLKEACASCHKSGAGNDSAWNMGAEADMTVAKMVPRLESDAQLEAVFAAIANKFLGIAESSPKPMPYGGGELTTEVKAKLGGILQWMKVKFPTSSQEGEARLGGLKLDLEGPRVSKRYKCLNVPTKGAFLRRLTNDIFERDPRDSELDKFHKGAAEANEPATIEYRRLIMDEMFKPKSVLNNDFNRDGLKRLSEKITGSVGLKPSLPTLTPEIIKDLQSEFLMALRKKVADTAFKDILLAKKVMVTKKTAPLYGANCVTAAETLDDASNDITKRYAECDLDEERSNFFGTIPYLALWKSSFLTNNNNYTRMAHMYTVLTGEALQPKTEGPTGGESQAGVSCIKSKDTRAKLADAADPTSALAKHGTLGVPKVGVFCQSCHIGRNLANGSIVFRPFHLNGEKLDKTKIADATQFLLTDPPTGQVVEFLTEVRAAAEPGRVFVDGTGANPTLVDISSTDGLVRLGALLDKTNDENKGCIMTTDDAGKPVTKTIKNLGDLTGAIIGDGRILIAGLARHIPRAFGNQAVTNQEILAAMSKANTDGGGKLYPLVRAYLETESYACGRSTGTPAAAADDDDDDAN